MIRHLFVILTLALAPVLGSQAYERDTHRELSKKAAVFSTLQTDPSLMNRLGLKAADKFLNLENKSKTISELIEDGADFEDNLFLGTPFRVRHHFYDPLHRRGLQWGLVSGEKSPDWALEDKQDYAGVSLRQDYSLKDARDYLYKALTSAQEDERKKNFGLTFQTIGHVIHHIQDMAQPQHVRNDVHPSVGAHKSLYEEYTNGVRGTLPVGPYAPVTFPEARDFWYNATVHPSGGSGIAEFTNNNFLSAGTNFQLDVNGKPAANATYKFPEWNGTTEEVAFWDLLKEEGINCAPPPPSEPPPAPPPPEPPPGGDSPPIFMRGISNPAFAVSAVAPAFVATMAQAAASVDSTLPPACELNGKMVFYGTTVTDNYAGTRVQNDRASTLSIFDQDLEKNNLPLAFTLNRFNFRAAYPHLIPKAVAYSAGLIDYFFRGRLEVQDASITDNGVSLRIRNAIDPRKQSYWKDENLVAGAKLVVTLQYRVPDNTQAAGFATKHFTSIPITLPEQLSPGRSSWNVYQFTGLPPIPDEATDIEYRLVYRGAVGQESDAIAVGAFKPVSGFLVTPNYAPADGLSSAGQRRLVYRTGGQWRLSKDTTLVAGNVDWKGWYQNDKATKLLSWVGSRVRYFPDRERCLPYRTKAGFYTCQWISSTDMDTSIYEGGALLAQAPGPVLAAAAARDVHGEDWLVAIVKEGAEDVVYRRPYQRSISDARYDVVNNPNGWREIGRYDGKANDRPGMEITHEADIPWSFNETGLEAQTMRRWWDISDGYITQRTKRLKVTIDPTVTRAEFADLGNRQGTRSATCSTNYDADGAGTGTLSSEDNGEQIIAVDYRYDGGSGEQLARVSWERSDIAGSSIAVSKQFNSVTGQWEVASRNGSFEGTRDHRETFHWGGMDLTVISDIDSLTAHWTEISSYTYSQETTSDYMELEIAYYLDLRHDLFSFYQQAWKESDAYSESGGVRNSSGEGKFDESHRILSAAGTTAELTPFVNSVLYTYQPGSSKVNKIECLPVNTRPPTPSYGYNFGWFWGGRVGGWAVDTQRNLVLSQHIWADGGYERKAPYSYITGDDLQALIRGSNVPPEPIYYPVEVVR